MWKICINFKNRCGIFKWVKNVEINISFMNSYGGTKKPKEK